MAPEAYDARWKLYIIRKNTELEHSRHRFWELLSMFSLVLWKNIGKSTCVITSKWKQTAGIKPEVTNTQIITHIQ